MTKPEWIEFLRNLAVLAYFLGLGVVGYFAPPLFDSPLGTTVIAVTVAVLLWKQSRRYRELAVYSFREWVRKTEGKIEAEKTKGKPEVIDLLEQYKARKRQH